MHCGRAVDHVPQLEDERDVSVHLDSPGHHGRIEVHLAPCDGTQYGRAHLEGAVCRGAVVGDHDSAVVDDEETAGTVDVESVDGMCTAGERCVDASDELLRVFTYRGGLSQYAVRRLDCGVCSSPTARDALERERPNGI